MATFSRAQESAQKLVAKFGRPVDLVSFGEALPFDNARSWRADYASEDVQTARAVFLSYAERLIDGTTIHEGDRKVLVAALGLTSPPRVSGEIRVDDDRWKIVHVEILSPNGEDILYTLQVRQ